MFIISGDICTSSNILKINLRNCACDILKVKLLGTKIDVTFHLQFFLKSINQSLSFISANLYF